MNPAQLFEQEIVKNQSVVHEIIRHKDASHSVPPVSALPQLRFPQDPFTVHTIHPKTKEKNVFEPIGQVLLTRMLQRTGQLEEFTSSLYAHDLTQFINNGYQIKEYVVILLSFLMLGQVQFDRGRDFQRHRPASSRDPHLDWGYRGEAFRVLEDQTRATPTEGCHSLDLSRCP